MTDVETADFLGSQYVLITEQYDLDRNVFVRLVYGPSHDPKALDDMGRRLAKGTDPPLAFDVEPLQPGRRFVNCAAT